MDAYKVLAAILMFFATAGVAWILVGIMLKPRVLDPKLGRFEAERRTRVRSASPTYLYFEPWVDELAEPIERTNKHLDEISQHIAASGINVPWKPAEFLATKRVEAFGAACVAFIFGWFLGRLVFCCLDAFLWLHGL